MSVIQERVPVALDAGAVSVPPLLELDCLCSGGCQHQ